MVWLRQQRIGACRRQLLGQQKALLGLQETADRGGEERRARSNQCRVPVEKRSPAGANDAIKRLALDRALQRRLHCASKSDEL
jgi:hypothetical protein